MFSKRIKYLRQSNNMKQQDLADILNVGKSTISNYETGYSSPDTDTLNKLADYFDVSTDYLLGRTDQKKTIENLPDFFESPEEAMKFILEDNTIMGFGGFDVKTMSDEEVLDFANELLNQLRLISYKYKK